MTSAEIRNEIYKYIAFNIRPQDMEVKVWQKHQRELSKLLKKFEGVINPPKEKKHKQSSQKSTQWQVEKKERDIKNGIWRPDEFYR